MTVYKKSPQSGVLLNGRYELEFIAASNYLGEFWKAKDIQEERFLAIRFIPAPIIRSRDDTLHIRTIFEKVVTLRHPAINPFYAIEDDPEYGCYLVMGWTQGQSLDEYISKRTISQRPISKKDALTILRPIADALDYAHGQNNIHCYLKPKNININVDSDGFVTGATLINFLLDTEIRDKTTLISFQNLNTTDILVYIAPEQWLYNRPHNQSDQYSLAIIAYKLFSGEFPYKGSNIEILRTSILNDKPRKIANSDKYINKALQKALSNNPDKRFKTCRAFIDALAGPHWLPTNAKWKIAIIGTAVAIVAALVIWKIFF